MTQEPEDIRTENQSTGERILILEQLDVETCNKGLIDEWHLALNFRGVVNASRFLPAGSDWPCGDNLRARLVHANQFTGVLRGVALSEQKDAEFFCAWMHILENVNTRHFLNYAHLDHQDELVRRLDHFRKSMEANGVDSESCCIDGSSVLAAYGIRPAADLDYLCLEGAVLDNDTQSCHNGLHDSLRESPGFDLTFRQIIEDPAFHFYYMGLKFTKLGVVRWVKSIRLMFGVYALKDAVDVRLIDEHLAKVESGKLPSRLYSSLRLKWARVADYRLNSKLIRHRIRKVLR